MTDVAEVLDRIAPPYDGAGDWDRVLRDAGLDRRSRRLPLRLAAAVAVVAAAAALVALWPSGTGPTVVDRALAATGGGPVLHLVYESDLEHTLVDLETGERTEVTAEQEVWFDPEAGLRETQRFEGVVQFDVSLTGDEVSEHASTLYTSLGAGYREALESGQAEVLGEDVVEGTPVYWIKIGPNNHDVAVSRETFEPAFIRVAQHGETRAHPDRRLRHRGSGIGAAGGHRRPRRCPARWAATAPTSSSPTRRRSSAARPVWAGPDVHGFPLDSVRELRLPTPDGEVDGAQPGVRIDRRRAARGDLAGGEPVDTLTMLAGVRGYEPPEGTVLLSGTMALLRSNGLVVTVHAPDEEMAIAIARELRPYSAQG